MKTNVWMLLPKHVGLIQQAECHARDMHRNGIEITAEGLFDRLTKGLKWKVTKLFGGISDEDARLVVARILEAEEMSNGG